MRKRVAPSTPSTSSRVADRGRWRFPLTRRWKRGRRPRDVKDLVEEYLRACRDEGVLQVRIIHGKGKGVQRRTVQVVCESLDWVRRYRTADEGQGGWGATLVWLDPPAR